MLSQDSCSDSYFIFVLMGARKHYIDDRWNGIDNNGKVFLVLKQTKKLYKRQW